MLDDMRLRNLAAGTCRSYVRSVAGFSAFHGRSPDQLTLEDVRDYQLHLVARGGSVSARASEYRRAELKPAGGQAASKIPSTAKVRRRRSSRRRSAGTCW